MAKRDLPPPDVLRQLLRYEPETGKLFWLVDRGTNRLAGKEAFTAVTGEGYRHGSVLNRTYPAHRVAWALHYGWWPVEQIDHINGVKHDNRLSNLREATNTQNMRNKGPRSDNKSGLKGVYWNSTNKRWKAQIYDGGKVIYLGLFDTAAAAHAAYCAAAEKYHGEFARVE